MEHFNLKVHDAKNTTLANIVVGREFITLGRIPHAGTNLKKWLHAPLNVTVANLFHFHFSLHMVNAGKTAHFLLNFTLKETNDF